MSGRAPDFFAGAADATIASLNFSPHLHLTLSPLSAAAYARMMGLHTRRRRYTANIAYASSILFSSSVAALSHITPAASFAADRMRATYATSMVSITALAFGAHCLPPPGSAAVTAANGDGIQSPVSSKNGHWQLIQVRPAAIIIPLSEKVASFDGIKV